VVKEPQRAASANPTILHSESPADRTPPSAASATPALSSSPPGAPIRVLLVEDDDSYAEFVRHLLSSGANAARFTTDRAVDLKQALARLKSNEVDALLLDAGLPDASRLAGLQRVLAEHPALPVVLITANGERGLGLEAVGAGAQDFLVKDQVTVTMLERTLRYAVERVRAIRQEKQLLEETLHGTIKALTTVLSLVNPTAFGRAQRLKEYVSGPAELLGTGQQWTVEVAAMVSQIGWVQHSPEACEKQYSTSEAAPEGRRLVQDMPAIAAELLDGIPHLDSVREILKLQLRRSGGMFRSDVHAQTSDVLLGAELLFLAIQFDILETQLASKEAALDRLWSRREEFEASVFRAFVQSQRRMLASSSECAITARELVEGMVLADDVLTPEGRILVARGHEVTQSLLTRLRFYSERSKIKEPIRVHAPRSVSNSARVADPAS